MDGKLGWLAVRYNFWWVSVNGSYMDSLAEALNLRWPTTFNLNTETKDWRVGVWHR